VTINDTETRAGERLAYSPAEAAEAMGVSKEHVHNLIRTGELKSRKSGRRRLISRRAIEDFLAGDDAA
jgi:excisionase family DNA binding protein